MTVFSRLRVAGARLLAALVLAGTVGACDDVTELSEQEFIQRAQEYRLAGDLQASAIELKNALKQNPQSAPARFLLGLTYVDIGNGPSAEKELLLARGLGVDEEALILPLGRALLLQEKFDRVLDEFSPDRGGSKAYKARVSALRGFGYLGLGRLGEAERGFRDAIEGDANLVLAYEGLVQLAIERGDLDQARSHIARALELEPLSVDVRVLSADVMFILGDYPGSESTLQALVEERPDFLPLRVSLGRVHIAMGKLDAAARDFDHVLSIIPNQPLVTYFRALTAYLAQEYEAATTYAEAVLASDEQYVPNFLVAAAANYALGRLEQANKQIDRFLAALPEHREARRLRAAILLGLERGEEAISVLSPLLEQNQVDAGILELIGTAAVQTGDFNAGGAYFHEAVELHPENAQLRTRLGTTQVALGDQEQGIEQLERAIAIDPELITAKVALILTHIKAKEFDRALELAKQLQDTQPTNPIGYSLTGIAYAALGQEADAKAAFNKALEVRPGDPSAAANLASYAEKDGDLDEARRLYGVALQHNPDHADTLARLSAMEFRSGRHEEAAAALARIVDANPSALMPRVLLARMYLQMGNPLKALSMANTVAPEDDSNFMVLEIIGRAQYRLGQAAEAVATFGELATVRPDLPQTHYYLARAYEQRGDLGLALKELRSTLSLDPDNVDAKFTRARLLAMTGDLAGAKELLEKLKQSFPDNPRILEVEGGIALAENRPRDAIDLLAGALKGRETNATVIQLATAQQLAGDADAGEATLREWLEKYPEDILTRSVVANTYLIGNRWEEARTEYDEIIRRMPDHPLARNNLAWLLLQAGETEKALPHARRARELMPNDPDVMDTLGLVLLERGEIRNARRLFEDAANRSPANLDVKHHLARALVASGEEDEARDLLRRILSDGTPFSERAEAEALLAELGG